MNSFIKSSRQKRRVLVVDDELVNRELLDAILSLNYDVTGVPNGSEAMKALYSAPEPYSLILLDLLMPQMSGFQVLEACKSDEKLKKIPIIVMTSEKSAEVRSIRMGADDFIPKPYRMPEVIIARCERIIELSEEKSLIRSLETDSVTGLYTKDFFYAYLRRLVQGSKPAMDAIHIELDGFRSFNHYQGHENGNLLLKKTAELITRELVKVKGIACHLSLGEFCVYCRHKTNYPEIFEKMQRELSEEKGYDAVTLKAGICEKVDKTAALESWFECAKTACRDAAAREGVQTEIYSGNFLETDRLVEQLKDNIQSEIRQKNFILKYVPVYRLDSGDAKLVGVEVKTFWNTSRFGMIDPAQYVPLMQRHGLIAELDNYVRREAAAQINRWRNKFGIMLSATLRLSGAALSDSKIVSKFDELADEFSLSSYSFVLAVKETLFSADDGSFFEALEDFKKRGYRIRVDGFGSGNIVFSKLFNLPADIVRTNVKLADSESKNTAEIAKQISGLLNKKIAAAEIETKEQLDQFIQMGYDYAMGSYFSGVMTADEFETLIEKEINK